MQGIYNSCHGTYRTQTIGNIPRARFRYADTIVFFFFFFFFNE